MNGFTIDTAIIQGQLEEIVGAVKIKIKIDKHLDTASSVYCADDSFIVRLNPNKIRSQPKLDAHLELARQAMTIG